MPSGVHIYLEVRCLSVWLVCPSATRRVAARVCTDTRPSSPPDDDGRDVPGGGELQVAAAAVTVEMKTHIKIPVLEVLEGDEMRGLLDLPPACGPTDAARGADTPDVEGLRDRAGPGDAGRPEEEEFETPLSGSVPHAEDAPLPAGANGVPQGEWNAGRAEGAGAATRAVQEGALGGANGVPAAESDGNNEAGGVDSEGSGGVNETDSVFCNASVNLSEADGVSLTTAELAAEPSPVMDATSAGGGEGESERPVGSDKAGCHGKQGKTGNEGEEGDKDKEEEEEEDGKWDDEKWPEGSTLAPLPAARLHTLASKVRNRDGGVTCGQHDKALRAATQLDTHWICNACNVQAYGGFARWRCSPCDYDLCDYCFYSKLQPQLPDVLPPITESDKTAGTRTPQEVVEDEYETLRAEQRAEKERAKAEKERAKKEELAAKAAEREKAKREKAEASAAAKRAKAGATTVPAQPAKRVKRDVGRESSGNATAAPAPLKAAKKPYAKKAVAPVAEGNEDAAATTKTASPRAGQKRKRRVLDDSSSADDSSDSESSSTSSPSSHGDAVVQKPPTKRVLTGAPEQQAVTAPPPTTPTANVAARAPRGRRTSATLQTPSPAPEVIVIDLDDDDEDESPSRAVPARAHASTVPLPLCGSTVKVKVEEDAQREEGGGPPTEEQAHAYHKFRKVLKRLTEHYGIDSAAACPVALRGDIDELHTHVRLLSPEQRQVCFYRHPEIYNVLTGVLRLPFADCILCARALAPLVRETDFFDGYKALLMYAIGPDAPPSDRRRVEAL